MVKKESFDNVITRFLLKTYSMIPVDRDKKDLESMKAALKVPKENKILALFPEGTRNGMERGVTLKNGAMSIALKAGVPIVPVGVKGTFRPFSKVKYKYGKPINFSERGIDPKNKEEVTKLTNELMEEIIKLRDEL
jgi:1-acyl-sn-glycerol-3-phosphate acyltransferase